MTQSQRDEYVKYLRKQAYWLGELAKQIEQEENVTTDWMIDWQLRRERELLDVEQAFTAELEQAAGETKGAA
jgi:hypothetical protein